MLTTYPKPFGDYLKSRAVSSKKHSLLSLLRKYRSTMGNLPGDVSQRELFMRIISLSRYIDKRTKTWRQDLGGRVTPFSTFRGYFIEEVAITLAYMAIKASGRSSVRPLVTKLPTGGGIVTGIALAFSKGKIRSETNIVLRRDREDVVVGFPTVLSIRGDGNTSAKFSDEIVPACILACKMYIDATRLENVMAKVKNFYAVYSSARFYAVSEWNALGADWLDAQGRVLDSLFAPVTDIIFLRGNNARRPHNENLEEASIEQPYQTAQLKRIYKEVQRAISEW